MQLRSISLKKIALGLQAFATVIILFSAPTFAASSSQCGGPGQEVNVSIDLGCSHKGNPIFDLTFAIVRWLSDGVGFILVASLVVAGIQYSSSRGDPQATVSALKRVQSIVTALVVFAFAYAFLNYLLPGVTLK